MGEEEGGRRRKVKKEGEKQSNEKKAEEETQRKKDIGSKRKRVRKGTGEKGRVVKEQKYGKRGIEEK